MNPLQRLRTLTPNIQSLQVNDSKGTTTAIITDNDGTEHKVINADFDKACTDLYELVQPLVAAQIAAAAEDARREAAVCKYAADNGNLVVDLKVETMSLESYPEQHSAHADLVVGPYTFNGHFGHWNQKKIRAFMFGQAYTELVQLKAAPSK